MIQCLVGSALKVMADFTITVSIKTRNAEWLQTLCGLAYRTRTELDTAKGTNTRKRAC